MCEIDLFWVMKVDEILQPCFTLPMSNFPPATPSKSSAMTGLPPPPPPGDGPTSSSPPPPPPPRRADGPTVVQRGWEGLKVCEEAIFFLIWKRKCMYSFQKMQVIWKRRMWERWAFVSCKKGCGGLWTLQGQGVRTSRLSKSSRRFRQPWCVFHPSRNQGCVWVKNRYVLHSMCDWDFDHCSTVSM